MPDYIHRAPGLQIDAARPAGILLRGTIPLSL